MHSIGGVVGAIIRLMPAKKTILSDSERAKRIREAAKSTGASDDPKVLDKALKKVAARSRIKGRTSPRP